MMAQIQGSPSRKQPGKFHRILGAYCNLFAVWVVLFGMLAWVDPGPFLAIQSGMKWFFALAMFGIGATLTSEDFLRIIRRPGIVLLGSCAQFSLMPLGAWLLGRIFGLPDDLAVGLILTGAAPGAMASNVITYLAGADVAYSISITTLSTLICPIMTPGLTALLAGARMEVPFWTMVLDVALTVVAPVLAGTAFHMCFRKRIEGWLPLFPAVSTTFLVFITSSVVALNRDRLSELTGVVFLVCLLLNLWGLGSGYITGVAARLPERQRRTLSIEIGMQNAGLGVVLAMKYFGARATLPAAAFVFLCILTAAALAAFWRWRDGKQLAANTGLQSVN